MDFIKNLREQLVEKSCLSIPSTDTGYQKIANKAPKRDKCYSPVICNQKEKAEPRWTQIQPFPHCDETSLQDLRVLFDKSKNEIIKKIKNLPIDSPCCQLKVNATIESLQNKSWALSEEDAEDCFVPVYCHYSTGVGDNWMRFYPEKCKSLVSVQQAVNVFDSVLNEVQEDFASEMKEKCDVSTTSMVTPIETTSAQTFDAPNVIIDEVLQDSFRLSWSEVNGTSSYEYKCTPRDTDYISTSNKSVEIGNLTANTEYTCSVRATNGSIKENSGFAAQTTCPTYDKTTPDCNAAYNGTCFKFVANGTSTALATASQFCGDRFQLGNITDDCMFYALKKLHENEKFGGGSGEQYWTGSQITPQDVDDYHNETGYIYNNWRSDVGLDPKVGQYITIKAQNFLGTKFEILGSAIKTGGEENKLNGAFCVKV